MKSHYKRKFGYSFAEISLTIAVIAILAGTAAGIVAINYNNQTDLDNAKINLANKSIAEVYSENVANASRDEVMALLSSKENFIAGFSQYFDTKPGETSISGTNFEGVENQTFEAITLENGVSIGFEYIRENCEDSDGAPCAKLHVNNGTDESSLFSDFYVYEDHITNKMPYNPQYQTYDEATNSFYCDSEKAESYLASINDTKQVFDNESETCYSECKGIKVPNSARIECVCPDEKPADLKLPEYGIYDKVCLLILSFSIISDGIDIQYIVSPFLKNP